MSHPTGRADNSPEDYDRDEVVHIVAILNSGPVRQSDVQQQSLNGYWRERRG